MQAFVGQTRQKTLIAKLEAAGIGEMTVRGEYRPRRAKWAYDNGAFRDFTAGKKFDEQSYIFDLLRFARSSDVVGVPSFIIIPDVVADAKTTLQQAPHWIARTRELVWPRVAPLALALQDGMTPYDVAPLLKDIDVLFVGGSVDWKWQTAADWCAFAREHGKRCHIGRVGTPKLVARAAAAKADSIDSCFPLWSAQQMEQFVEALRAANAAERPSATRELQLALAL